MLEKRPSFELALQLNEKKPNFNAGLQQNFCQKLSLYPQSEFVKEGVKRGSDKIVGASSTASSTDGSNIAQKTERLRLK